MFFHFMHTGLHKTRGLLLRHVRILQRRRINSFISRVPASESRSLPPKDSNGAPKAPRRFRLAVKDNIATGASAGSLPTTCASEILSTYYSPFEATIVRQLRALGGQIVGKTNLDEFGMGSHSLHSFYGPAYQSSGRSAGGSSGGSALAVSEDGAADVGLGTDTGGSVRLPAAYTGCVGYKPSYGMLSRHGVVPYANSLDTVAMLAREVQSIARLMIDGGLWKQHDPKDPTSLKKVTRMRCASQRECYDERRTWPRASNEALAGLTIGIPLEYNVEELEPAIKDTWTAAADRLADMGARIEPVRLPSTRHALSAYYVIAPAEASSNLAKYDGIRYGKRLNHHRDMGSDGALYAPTRGAFFGDEVRRRILLGSFTLSSGAIDNYFVQAQRVRQLVRRDFDRVFRLENPLVPAEERRFNLSDLPGDVPLEDKLGPAEVDFLLCPTAPTVAPMVEDILRRSPRGPDEEGLGALEAYMNDVFTVPASLAGLPGISLPVALPSSESGKETAGDDPLFAGMQLIGQFWDDARLLNVAAALQEVLGGVRGKEIYMGGTRCTGQKGLCSDP